MHDPCVIHACSAGLTALMALNVLEGFDLAAMGHNSPAYLHDDAVFLIIYL
jgi:gamma-glutamyltranspeptidase